MAALEALLAVVLANDGHWRSGGQAEVRLSRVAAARPLTVSWQVHLREVVLVADTVRLPADGVLPAIHPTLPAVRVATPLTFTYRVVAADGVDVQRGDLPVVVHPVDRLDDLRAALGPAAVAVLEPADGGLAAGLRAGGIPVAVPDDWSRLATTPADLLLVGAGVLVDPLADRAVADFARAGHAVVVFAQPAEAVLGLPTTARSGPLAVRWSTAPPAAAEAGFTSQAGGPGATLRTIPASGLPPASVVLAGSAAGEALVLALPLGAGRVVLCQLPLGPWVDDPRGALLLPWLARTALHPADSAIAPEGDRR